MSRTIFTEKAESTVSTTKLTCWCFFFLVIIAAIPPHPDVNALFISWSILIGVIVLGSILDDCTRMICEALSPKEKSSNINPEDSQTCAN